jgi:hypothetical protein
MVGTVPAGSHQKLSQTLQRQVLEEEAVAGIRQILGQMERVEVEAHPAMEIPEAQNLQQLALEVVVVAEQYPAALLHRLALALTVVKVRPMIIQEPRLHTHPVVEAEMVLRQVQQALQVS